LGISSIGGVSQEENLELVKQSIIQILLTHLGSRVMRRDFGSRLRELVFDPNDELLDTELIALTKEAIERWEKRVRITNAQIVNKNPDAGQVEVAISFLVLKTQQPGNLVLPFFSIGAPPAGAAIVGGEVT